MFSRDSISILLKKPKLERTKSAPAASKDSPHSITGMNDKRFSFRKRRAQHYEENKGGIYHSACCFGEQYEPSSFSSLDDATDAATTCSTLASRHSTTTSMNSNRKNPLIKALVAALQEDHMLDVTLVGKEGVKVRASRYVLGCVCEALEDKLYQHHSLGASCTQAQREEDEEIYIGDYSETAVEALVEYCFTGELLEFWAQTSSKPEETAVKSIIEISRLAKELSFRPLKMELYQLSRRLMNQHPSTACLFYSNTESPLDARSYAQQTLSECPEEALLTPTNNYVTCLPAARLETLFDDGTLEDLEEIDKVKLLQLWSEGDGNDVQVARRCSLLHIDLSRVSLDDEQTITTLKSSHLFDEEDIAQVQNTATTHAASPHQQHAQVERVIVHGAGNDSVNVVFLRRDSEQDMYSTTCDTYTLHFWNGTWHIAASCDLSNSLYKCTGETSAAQVRVPSSGWQSVGAPDPAPQCTWIPPLTESVSVEEEKTK